MTVGMFLGKNFREKNPLEHFGAPNGSSTVQGIKMHHPLVEKLVSYWKVLVH